MRSSDDHDFLAGSDRQWWLTEGPERCFICEASIHPEVLAYCFVCDRGLCSLCLYEGAEPGHVLCPECAAEGREST